MTDQSSPITPPPELVQQWLCSDDYPWGPLEQTSITITANRLQSIATAAAQWGADQELEACCEWTQGYAECGDSLRAARRPKPPTLKELKEQALAAAARFYAKGHEDCTEQEVRDDYDTLCRALKALPND
jgi:hypothetical protein